jgi:hypothetical protein
MSQTGDPTTRVPPSPAPGGAPVGNSLLPDDWPAQTADRIEQVIGTVRDKTVAPVERITRIVVYGIVAGIVGIASAILLAIAVVRILDVYIPADVWAAHAVTGGIFTLGGLFLWSKRSRS